jgi:RNA polymerase sigma-70 factor (ECF subfamily)
LAPLVLSSARHVADDLLQATCLRAIERADQFIPGTRVDRWLFAILRPIWLNEVRARRVRQGGGFVDAENVLTIAACAKWKRILRRLQC